MNIHYLIYNIFIIGEIINNYKTVNNPKIDTKILVNFILLLTIIINIIIE